MQSRKVTLPNNMVLNSSRSNQIDLPMDSIINQVRIRVIGTYTGMDANLAAEFPYNIFRNITVKTGKGAYPYSIASKDLRIMNYLDKAGKVTSSASGGNFEMNLILDRGELLALKQNQMPDNPNHPSLPFNSLSLSAVWAQDADCGTSIAITAATAEVEVEQTPVSIAELQAIYGASLERYQLPEVYTKGDIVINTNTKPSQSIILDVGRLKKRTIAVTSDSSVVRNSTIVTEVQLNNQKTGYERTPIDRTFKTMQNNDAEEYNLGTILAGVAAIDYPTEISNDPYGLPSWRLGDKDFSIYTQNASNGNIRVIEEQRIVNITEFERGNILGVVTGTFAPAAHAK
jgi:hypothetical protein